MQLTYVHGFEAAESTRLQDQAQTLEALLHAGTAYGPGSIVIEPGCGIGAQTIALARNSPEARIEAVEISPSSLAEAQARAASAGLVNVRFQAGDVMALPFADGSVDHAFVCFLLEHLRCPAAALNELRRVLKRGGTITVIEGDHGSALFHPDSDAARAAIDCQVELQRRAGGDATIGRRLFPLLDAAKFGDVSVSPRLVYADAGQPALAQAFIEKTFVAMIAGVRESAIRAGLIGSHQFDAGIAALRRTAEPEGTFCYTFFKAIGRKR